MSPAWDLLNLLTCAPGSISDHLLTDLGVTVPALRSLDEAKLIKRDARGVAFRHDLCRRAVSSCHSARRRDGPAPSLHRAHREASARRPRGAHPPCARRRRQGADRIGGCRRRPGGRPDGCPHPGHRVLRDRAWSTAVCLPDATEAELLELLADEYYLTDRLDDAIGACRRAMRIRQSMGAPVAVSADHHSLAVYEWYNGNRAAADDHVADAIATLDNDAAQRDSSRLATAGARLRDAGVTLPSSPASSMRPRSCLGRAREIACEADDPALTVRVRLIEGVCDHAHWPRSRTRRGAVDARGRSPAHRRDLFQRLHQSHLLRRGAAAARRSRPTCSIPAFR